MCHTRYTVEFTPFHTSQVFISFFLPEPAKKYPRESFNVVNIYYYYLINYRRFQTWAKWLFHYLFYLWRGGKNVYICGWQAELRGAWNHQKEPWGADYRYPRQISPPPPLLQPLCNQQPKLDGALQFSKVKNHYFWCFSTAALIIKFMPIKLFAIDRWVAHSSIDSKSLSLFLQKLLPIIE